MNLQGVHQKLMRLCGRCSVLAAAVSLSATVTVASAQRLDVIRGRITGPDALPVVGALVSATSHTGGILRSVRTDRTGRFMLAFPNGEGDYWIEVQMIGYIPRRFQVRRIGDEAVLVADAILQSSIASLDAVTVTASGARALVNRNAAGTDVSGGDRALVTDVGGAELAGILAAMAAGVPGIQLIPGLNGAADMFSIFGLTGDQNNTTFNGLGSAVTALPPDALVVSSIRPYPFDVSIGGFSGAQIAIGTLPGSNFSRRTVSSFAVAPPLQFADDLAEEQGQEYTRLRAGGNAAGAFTRNRRFYNSAYSFSRRFNQLTTLRNAPDNALVSAGLASDSVRRFFTALQSLGIPASAAGVPRSVAHDDVQGMLNVDFVQSASGTGHALTLGVLGNLSRQDPAGFGATGLTTTPSHTGQATRVSGNAVVGHSNYLWFGLLSKTTLGLGIAENESKPYITMPQGVLRLTSDLPGNESAVKVITFGGSQLRTRLNRFDGTLANQLSWYSADNRHTMKITGELGYERLRSEVRPNALGTYTFGSLAELEANSPTAFTRTIAAPARRASQLKFAASAGDYWRPSRTVQVQFGVRLDGNRFLDSPARNARLDSLLGVRTDLLPDKLYVSPRIGLQWHPGTASQVAFVPGAARAPRAIVRAGIGVFQNIAPVDLVTPALSATGLAGADRAVQCVGAAVPLPDWSAFLQSADAIPTTCADGAAEGPLAVGTPNISAFARGFRQARALRAVADWSGPILDNRFVLGVQLVMSRGTQQAGTVDANFAPNERFALTSEAGRPVFVDEAAIVAATGATSFAASRRAPDFARVALVRSDLATRATQVSINLRPLTNHRRLKLDFTYTVLDAMLEQYGFVTTDADPLTRSRVARTGSGRHQLTVLWRDFPLFDLLYITLRAQLRSGARYTPVTSGDINGDGNAANDRAFLFGGNSAAGSPEAEGIRALMARGASGVRECLSAQLGRIAAHGSCQGPPTVATQLNIRFNAQKVFLPKRASVYLNIVNPLGLLDLALNGSNDLRGWGQEIPPDQNLLYVRGFDPATRRYRYEVNQRFGSTRPTQGTARALPYLGISVSVDVGAPRERQVLGERLRVGREGEEGAVAAKLPATSWKSHGMSTIPNPMLLILQQIDLLDLTVEQADSLATLSRRFASFADSVWAPVATYLAGLPDAFDERLAYRRYVQAREHTIDQLIALVPSVQRVLTASQKRRLPPQILNYLDTRVLRFLRSSSAGDASSIAVR